MGAITYNNGDFPPLKSDLCWRSDSAGKRQRKIRRNTDYTNHNTREATMAQATTQNQQKIMATQRTIVGNQNKILRNQQAILKNQKKILSNQGKILRK